MLNFSVDEKKIYFCRYVYTKKMFTHYIRVDAWDELCIYIYTLLPMCHPKKLYKGTKFNGNKKKMNSNFLKTQKKG